ncbi:MAG: HRDC domain-containing protein, partial [Firmicutes bacterium]|nr:HRDC domain-containing protein [Bacillota bacterium]
KKDFLSVSGVGEVKYKKYGDAFIEAINSFRNYYNI